MKDCRGELLARVRRGLASAQEQTAFEAHLNSCESCSMTLELMSDFDAVGGPESTDWERVALLAGAAAATHGRRLSPAFRAPRKIGRLALAALVLTGVAAAAVAVRLSSESLLPSEPAQYGDVATSGDSATASVPDSEVGAELETLAGENSTTADSLSEEPTPAAAVVPPNAASRFSLPTDSAKVAYKAANDARREGRTGEAIAGYQRLQRHFPGSPEARASQVSLGGLLLRTGSSSGALKQFDAYLIVNGGQLAAEALFGRAQALRALGRFGEEAQNLDRLLKNYPKSAYATHAQRRLLELR